MSQARLLWAYAMLGERMGGACLAALVGQARAELQRFSLPDLTLMLWSLCISQVRHCPSNAKLSWPSCQQQSSCCCYCCRVGFWLRAACSSIGGCTARILTSCVIFGEAWKLHKSLAPQVCH